MCSLTTYNKKTFKINLLVIQEDPKMKRFSSKFKTIKSKRKPYNLKDYSQKLNSIIFVIMKLNVMIDLNAASAYTYFRVSQ